MQRLLAFATVVALTTAASATSAAEPAPAAKSGSQCFRVSQIQNHSKGDDQTVYFGMRNRDVFRLTMSGNCLAGASSSDPLIMTPVAGNDVVCRPLDLDIKVRIGPGAISPCIIRDMTKLTPDEIAALPRKVKP